MVLQGANSKNRGFHIKFKGFLVEFLENRLSPERIKAPRKSPEKWIFLSLAFYNAHSLHTVKKNFGFWWTKPSGVGLLQRGLHELESGIFREPKPLVLRHLCPVPPQMLRKLHLAEKIV